MLLTSMHSQNEGLHSRSKTPSAILGLRLNADQDAAIRVEPCDDSLCGRIAWILVPPDEETKKDIHNPDETLRSRPILGLTILIGFPADPGSGRRWKGGRIYDPKSGKTYRSRMELEGDALRIRGYIGLPLLGRTTTWSRVTAAELKERGGRSL